MDVKFENECGIEPVSRFDSSKNWVRIFFRSPSCFGILPVIEFEAKEKYAVISVSMPNSEGIVANPEERILSPIRFDSKLKRLESLVNLPSSVGMLPVSEFEPNSKRAVIFVRYPSSVGAWLDMAIYIRLEATMFDFKERRTFSPSW